MKKQLTYILFAALGLCAASCTDDAQEATGVPGTTETVVPLSISFSGEWDTDDMTSRAAPPEQGDTNGDGKIDSDDLVGGTEEIKSIDKATVIVFRRSDPDVTGKPAGDFVYDPTNFQDGLTCRPKTEEEQNADPEHADNYMVEGAQLRKIYGFEYRVIAIAYDGDERDWFKLNNDLDGMTYEQFEMTMQGKKDVGEFQEKVNDEDYGILLTPQFFYGYCYTEGDDSCNPIIKYGTTEEEVVKGITGTLFRAVAKVDVELTARNSTNNRDITQAVLLMNNIYQKSYLDDYGKFTSPYEQLTLYQKDLLGKPTKDPVEEDENYLVVAYESNVPAPGNTFTFTAYVLQTITRLGAGIFYKGPAGVVSHTDERWFTAGNISFADGATGVISPDVYDNKFYFRRNHKYHIKGEIDIEDF